MLSHYLLRQHYYVRSVCASVLMHIPIACNKIRGAPQGIFLSRAFLKRHITFENDNFSECFFLPNLFHTILYLQWSGLNGTHITNRIITLLWISIILPFATLAGMKRRRTTELMKGLEEISVVGGWGLRVCLDWRKEGVSFLLAESWGGEAEMEVLSSSCDMHVGTD